MGEMTPHNSEPPSPVKPSTPPLTMIEKSNSSNENELETNQSKEKSKTPKHVSYQSVDEFIDTVNVTKKPGEKITRPVR